MPHYTTSYDPKKKPRYRQPQPRYRKNTSNLLPSGRRRQVKRKGGQYLRHSQGFSGRGNHGYGANERKPYAIIVVGCAFLLFLASIVWYANRGVDVELNGETVSVRINSTIEQLIESEGLEPKAGNLLAVDDTVLEKGKGERCSVKLGGKSVKVDDLSSVKLEGGEKLEIGNGADVYEDHDVQATTIQPTIKINGTGPVQYVRQWSEAGRSEVWTGKVSGKTADKGVVKEAVECIVECQSVSPDTKDKKYIALTFDESPSGNTQALLDILKEKGVKATFFVQGDSAEAHASAVKAIADAGMELGSNTYSDEDLTKLSGEELRSQITRGFDAVEQAGGGRTAVLRAPFGTLSQENWAQAADVFSAAITWNLDSGDWMLKGAQRVVDNVVSAAKNGNIVLLTDSDATAAQTAEALPQIIDRLQENGYTLVTLSELIQTDKDLAKAVSLDKAGLPKGASLPQVPQEQEAA